MQLDKCLQPKLFFVVGAVLLLFPAVSGAAGDIQPTASAHADVLVALETVPSVSAPPVDIVAVTKEDETRARTGMAPRFAIPNATSVTPETDGLWEDLDENTSVWRLRISSPGAKSLNLGFKHFFMPDGGKMLIYASDFSGMIRPVTAADNAAHGEFWSPIVKSDDIVVEVTLPTSERDALGLELTSVNVGYRGFAKGGADKSGSCNIDVVCPEGDGWRDEIPSVAVISTGGSLFCTGFMVNNTAEDQTPYFMTAYHCGIRSYNASSLVAYWNYETSTCGGTPDGSLSDWQSGSYFRSEYSTSDFTLVELDSDPDPGWGVTFAGWDRSGNEASTAVAIHHPSVDEKRISFEYDATTTTSYLGTSVPGDGTHVRVIDWDLGTTEGGSSGSPLFNQNHHVIGQLHGGYAACGNDLSDWYGKFSVSWTGGGSSSSRLSDWLDSGGTGAMTVNTLVPGAGYCGDGSCGSGEDQCNCPDDCGTPPSIETSCTDGIDNDCDLAFDCDDGDCTGDPACICDDDGTCEAGEDCNNCPNDCISGSGGAVCGNGLCEGGDGEDCRSCSADCNGKTTGAPSGRFCCGATEGCGDSRCTETGWDCTMVPQATPYCCGDGTCEGAEDINNCAIDCGCTVPADCDDSNECTIDDCVGGVCENTPVADDTPCSGGICCDGVCDAAVCSVDGDCGDGEACTTDICYGADTCSAYCDNVWPACGPADGCCGPTCDSSDPDCDACVPDGGYCTSHEDCCSLSCHPSKNYCR